MTATAPSPGTPTGPAHRAARRAAADRTAPVPPGPSTPAQPALTPEQARTARRGALSGLAATAAWVALGAESVVRGGEMHYRDALWTIPWTLTMITFAHLHVLQRRHNRWTAAAGGAVLVTMAMLLVGFSGLVLGVDRLAVLGFPLGALLWLVAMVPFGVATARAGVVPVRVGVALALLEPGSILTGLALSPIAGLHERGNFSGGLEKGLVVLVLATALGAAAGRAARHENP